MDDNAAPRTVHMASLADIDNFGDVLFPLLAAARLGGHGYRVAAVSPTGRACRWPDAPTSLSLNSLLETSPPSAGLLVGGGNFAIGRPMSRYECLAVEFWLSASWHAVVHNIPLIWNVPGVPRPFARQGIGKVARAAMEAADHLAVRDQASREFLIPATDRAIAVHPDTAIDTAAMWPKPLLAPHFEMLLARKGAPAGRPFLVIHMRGDAADAGLGIRLEAAAARLGMTALLLAIGPDAGDDLVLRRLAETMPSAILVDEPLSLKEIAAALAFSAGYLGQSMHGAIVAASYDVPGVLVGPPPARRFRGFQDYRGVPDGVATDFETGLGILAALPATQPLPASMRAELDAHWCAVRTALASPPQHPAARLAFLRSAAEAGARAGGAAWATLPMRISSHVAERQGHRPATVGSRNRPRP